MPRVSIRKLFIYLLGAASFVLVILNLQQNLVGHYTWNSVLTGPSGSGSGPGGTGVGAGGVGGVGVAQKREQKFPADASPLEVRYRYNGTTPGVPRRALDLSPLDPSDMTIPEEKLRPWYMREGELQPKHCPVDAATGERRATLFPDEDPSSDRIQDQLMFFPPKGVLPENLEDPATPLKKILLWNGVNSWGNMRPGRGVFLKEKCPVNACAVTSSRSDASSADLVIFKDHFTMPTYDRPDKQLWMMYMLECPLHTQMFKSKELFNWTATYRADSTVVAPYERWHYYNENVRVKEQGRNFAENKTKSVAWFVSNCGARNGRLQYAQELQKHIEVDIYGSCGTKKCPRSMAKNCFGMLDKDYKFYLAFENSNCKDYITEKFFVNGLGHDVIPIVMGARPEDYERSAPYHSFIHVDDFKNAEELAKYLQKLDQNDDLYNEYFKWKGTGEFVNTKFFCRLCSLLHDPKKRSEVSSYYPDINDWWRAPGTCITGSWTKYKLAVEAQSRKNNASLPHQEGEEVVAAAAEAGAEEVKLP